MTRVRSIDILRGAIMLLMAIDHIRVFSGIPAGDTELYLFLTRWITNFCAPGFAFFAGTAIFYQAQKTTDKNSLSIFLIKRGLLLVVLELTVIRFFWTFNLNYSDFVLAGVIWMLGWCMALMALLIRLKSSAVGIIGFIIILAQQFFLFVPKAIPRSLQPQFINMWQFIYPAGVEETGAIHVLYVIVPWIGVMALGYGFGLIMIMTAHRRKRICLIIGVAFIALFAIIGSVFSFNSTTGENALPFIFRLLNQNKYPPSPLFLLMTLGPLIALIPIVEKAKGRFLTALSVIGKVPLFYYLLHILLIHISAIAVNLVRDGQTHQAWYQIAPFGTRQAKGVRWGLPLLYFVFLIDTGLLYFACNWYLKYKKGHPEKKWLKYI
jgi:uncharacterized membrane protein